VTPPRTEDEITLSCFSAERCAAAPCARSDWRRLSEVTLRASFFESDATSDWQPIDAAIVLPDSFFEPPTAGEPDDRASSIQIARDRRSVLVNKDLDGQRWAIARSLDDGSVSGSVFDPGDGSADVLWCTPAAAQTPGTKALSCFLAASTPQSPEAGPPS
jgi:hypothetical protein